MKRWMFPVVLLACALASCGPPPVRILSSPNPAWSGAQQTVSIEWETFEQPESREDPIPKTQVRLTLRGSTILRADLGSFPGSCWSDQQGWQKAPAEAIGSVQCTFAGSATSVYLVREGLRVAVVRTAQSEETEPAPSVQSGRVITRIDLPADFGELRRGEGWSSTHTQGR